MPHYRMVYCCDIWPRDHDLPLARPGTDASVEPSGALAAFVDGKIAGKGRRVGGAGGKGEERYGGEGEGGGGGLTEALGSGGPAEAAVLLAGGSAVFAGGGFVKSHCGESGIASPRGVADGGRAGEEKGRGGERGRRRRRLGMGLPPIFFVNPPTFDPSVRVIRLPRGTQGSRQGPLGRAPFEPEGLLPVGAGTRPPHGRCRSSDPPDRQLTGEAVVGTGVSQGRRSGLSSVVPRGSCGRGRFNQVRGGMR